MFVTKLYKYDSTQEANGYRGEDFSPYVLQGSNIKEDITQELDTAELTLAGLSFNTEFAPETKFILDIVDKQIDQETIAQTSHLCVSRDIVNQPILSDNNYYDHHLYFIEPSVVAQKRLVDNIAITYKLKDVTLENQPAYDTSLTPSFKNQSSSFIPNGNFGVTRNVYFFDRQYVRYSGKYFRYEDENGDPATIQMLDASNNVINKRYISTNDYTQVKFKIPRLAIYGGLKNSTQFRKIGYASIKVNIEEFDLTNAENPTDTWEYSFISRSNLASDSDFYNPYFTDWSTQTAAPAFLNEWLFEFASSDNGYDATKLYYRKYTDTTAGSDPTYETPLINIQEDKNYVVTVCLHEFTNDIPKVPNNLDYDYAYKYTLGQPSMYVNWDIHYSSGEAQDRNVTYNLVTYNLTTDIQTNGITEYTTYLVDDAQLVYNSSTPYSALALLQKAIINSSVYEKKQNVYIADVNNSNLPFYIDPNYVNKLSATKVIENFYNQKNLWEVALDVGHYIHAIPELKFGSDDRFMFTFNELGRTDQKQDNSTKVSIFNSRSVEDYISATSSYVSNMVQLGGYIEEWVAPKTQDETLLVHNDTACIITSKPIIELLDIKVKRISDNEIADMTSYVFEENIYNTIGIDYTTVPNRGIAMYYKLGTNAIVGGDYRIPTTSTGAPQNDYTFKKIIYSAFNGYNPSNSGTNYWEGIKINDYIFFVKYRTKDDVRQTHTRPDLRKYLLNSQYDRYPQHNQFNNQQDVLVDSIKFGNNLYGKLIKTGNSEYTKSEWNTDYNNVKHKGELYNLNGELYYVANVIHEIYSSYVVSEIKFSKDYNELSAVIGIPSEPRFYEISEQSQIRRDVAINDLLLLTTSTSKLSNDFSNTYISNYWHLNDLMFSSIFSGSFMQYAITVFKGDKDIDKYDQTVGEPTFYKEVITPINAYSSGATLTYEWDMVDNYGAGDQVVYADTPSEVSSTDAYKSLLAYRYTDIYGKSALMDFYLLGEGEGGDVNDLIVTQDVKNFPASPFATKLTDTSGRYYIFDDNIGLLNDIAFTNIKDLPTNNTNYNSFGLGLLKDNREAISINYNLQLITDSDKFVISPFVFLPRKTNIKVAFLNTEINKLTDGYIDNSTFIDIKSGQDGSSLGTTFDIVTETEGNNKWQGQNSSGSRIRILWGVNCALIDPRHFTGEDGFERVKAIAILCNVSPMPSEDSSQSAFIPNKTQFIIGRNVQSTERYNDVVVDWYLGAPKKNVFREKQ